MNTFYLDMDGVVADWTTAAAQIIGYRMEDPHGRYPDSDWQKLRGHSRFFLTLPKMAHADQLVDLARDYRDQLGWQLLFLTAIPHDNDVPWAIWDKVLWAQTNYPDIPVHFGPYSRDKQAHCSSGDILVDDRLDNCAQWTSAGGLSFKVPQGPLAVRDVLGPIREDLDRRLALKRLREDYKGS